jgi:hypothetical protein
MNSNGKVKQVLHFLNENNAIIYKIKIGKQILFFEENQLDEIKK